MRQQKSRFVIRSIDRTRGNINSGIYDLKVPFYAKSIEFTDIRIPNLFYNIRSASDFQFTGPSAYGNVIELKQPGPLTFSMTIQPGNYYAETGEVNLGYALANPTEGLNDIRFFLLRVINSAGAQVTSVSINATNFLMTIVFPVFTTTTLLPSCLGIDNLVAGTTWLGTSPVNLSYPNEFYIVIPELFSNDQFLLTNQVNQGIFSQCVASVPVTNSFGGLLNYEPTNISPLNLMQSSIKGNRLLNKLSVLFYDRYGNLLPMSESQDFEIGFFLRTEGVTY